MGGAKLWKRSHGLSIQLLISSAEAMASIRLLSHKLRLGDEERRLMHLVPAPAVRLMKRRV